MQIEYVTNGSRRMVTDTVGRTLIARKIARAVETRQVIPEDAGAEKESSAIVEAPAIKPKRKYKRRDMKAES